MKQKNNTPNPSTMLIYVAILLFALLYEKTSSGDKAIDSIVAIAVAAGVFVGFALLKFFKDRKK